MCRSFLCRRAALHAAGCDPAVRLLPGVLLAAPLVVLPGHVDFARLPQQAFVVVSALVISLLWVVRGGPATDPGRTTRLDFPLLAFLAWSAASLLVSAEPAAGLATLGHWTACALVFAVVSRAARTDDVPRLASGLLLGGALVAAVGLGQALFGLALVPQAAAPAATLANRGVAAGYLAALAPLALLAWPGRTARIAAAVAAGTMMAFLPFTQSRAAAVAVGVQLVLLVALRERPPGRRALIRVALTLCASGLALGAAVWLSVADPAKARSANIRWSLAGSALSMARDRPLLGAGLGSFGALYPSHGPLVTSSEGAPLRVDSPHNEGLQVLAETGLPGLLAGLWVAASALGALRRLRRSSDPAVRRAALALGLSFAGLAVDGALGFPLRNAVPPLVLAVLLGLLAALDVGEPRGARRIALLGRPVRLAAVAALAVALAGALSWSLRRLENDRALYLSAFLPVVHAQARSPRPEPAGRGSEARLTCGPDVTLDRKPNGRIDLVARAAPLADVLACLVEHAGLRLEYDGRPPRPAVSVALYGETLAGAVTSLLEGLGVDYLLGLDPSGTAGDRLIVFDSSRGTEPSRGRARPAAGGGQAMPPLPVEPGAEAEDGTPSGMSPFGGPPPASGTVLGAPGPGGEPEPVEPEELTPMTLQFGRQAGSRVARIGILPVRRPAQDHGAPASGSSGNRNGPGS